MQFKAVIFDLDGTLLDTLADLADSMNSVLSHSGYPTHPLEAFKGFVGDGMENLVRRALPPDRKGEEETVASCLAAMRHEYRARWKEKTGPYPGIPQLLDALTAHHLPKAILSNKPDDFTKQMVAELLSRWSFDPVFGERAGIRRKPDPAGALEIAGRLGFPPRTFLYLGDTNTDMQTARAAGMRAVGVLWGFRGADELLSAGAETLLESPLDLLRLLE